MDTPGIGTKFSITLTEDWIPVSKVQVEVVKIYKKTIWSKLLLWLGFSVKLLQVKTINKPK